MRNVIEARLHQNRLDLDILKAQAQQKPLMALIDNSSKLQPTCLETKKIIQKSRTCQCGRLNKIGKIQKGDSTRTSSLTSASAHKDCHE